MEYSSPESRRGIARLVEEVEAQAWSDVLSAATGAEASIGGRTLRLEGAVALSCTGVDVSLFNRIIGAGVFERATRAGVERLLGEYPARGVRRIFVHVSEAARPLELRHWLEAAGLVRYHRSWAKLVRGREAVPKVSTAMALRAATAEHAEAFGRILTEGFDLPAGSAPLFRAMVGRNGWHALLAFEQARDTPVAAGSLFVAGDVGYLAGGATLKPYRGRGAQGALMAKRLELALDLGCRWIITETGEAVPDQPNHSYNNMLRTGFSVVGSRENYTLPGARW
jgi:GNAT superfamily N-acetyltransferase